MGAERWNDAFLDQMRKVADPLADDLIQETFNLKGREGLYQLNLFLQNWTAEDSPDLTPGVRAFLKAPVHYPPWVDLARIRDADRLFYNYGIVVILVLFMRSLPQFMANADADHVFARANLFNPKTVKRFMIEIAQLIFDVVKPGALRVEPDKGPGTFALQKLRLHHSIIRFEMFHHRSLTERTPWDPAWGEPINQEDLACAVLAFSLYNIDGFKKLRLGLTGKEEEATLEAWKVTGFLLGLSEELQVADMREGRQLLAAIGRRQFHSSPQGTKLVRQLLGVVESFLPWYLRGVPVVVMRYLMDPEFVILLKVPRAYGPTWLVIWILQLFAKDTALQKVLEWISAKFLQGLVSEKTKKDRQGNRGNFRLPDEVAARLKA